MTDTNKERAGRFTKRPVTIDAWLIDPANKPHPAWVHNAFAGSDIDWCPAGKGLYINTLEGHMLGGHGDYLIRGVQSELYACKAHIFAATYEPEARAAKAPAAPTQASPDGWKWMTHPSRNGGLPIPVRVFAEDGVTYYQPFSEADCEFEWESRDSEWHEAAPPAPTEQQIGALQAELAGNEAATMHLSRMVDELRALLCQAMRVMKDLHESATPDESREDCPPIIPTSDFAKFVNDNAALMYAIKQCGHDPAPPQGAAKGATDAASS